MDIVKKQRAFFLAIYNAEQDQEFLKELLQNMNRRQAHAISLVALNTLHGAIGVSEQKKKVLKDIKPYLRALAAEGDSLNVKKDIIASHVHATFIFIRNMLKILDDLIWRDI